MLKEEAIKIFFSARKLAKMLGISYQAVCQWPNGEHIPHLRELQIIEILKRRENYLSGKNDKV